MKNQIVIHASEHQIRTALLENGELTQLFIESENNQRTVGNIYLAKVHKVMSGIKAAFIDMGTPKDAFLHFSDGGDHLESYIRLLNGDNAVPKKLRKSPKEISKLSSLDKQRRVGDILKPGQKVLVQIVKEPIGSKGPRVSTDITIAGRYLVLIPMGDYIAVSRKINSKRERRKLKGIVGSMLPKGFGVIIRTVAKGVDKEALEDDMRNVLKKWETILNRLEGAKPTTLLYKDLDMTESLIRDMFSKHYNRVLVDDSELYETIKSYVKEIAPNMLPNVQLYKGSSHIFDFMNIAKDVDSIFSPRVSMPSGGYLIFEQTEAMYVVDVNSGPYAAKKRQEDNSLKTNLDAAREVAKQLRLRDIGGIIVVDFIDLKDPKNRKKVYDELKKEFHKDQAKTNVLPMSDFGLVQITRQRIRPSVVNSVSNDCPMCNGTGNVISSNTVLEDIDAWLSKFRSSTKYRRVHIHVSPYLKSYITSGFLKSLRCKWMYKYFLKINVVEDELMSVNDFKATLPGSEVEITDAVLQEENIRNIVQQEENIEESIEDTPLEKQEDDLELYSNENGNGNANRSTPNAASNTNLPPRPSRRASTNKSDSSTSKYYK